MKINRLKAPTGASTSETEPTPTPSPSRAWTGTTKVSGVFHRHLPPPPLDGTPDAIKIEGNPKLAQGQMDALLAGTSPMAKRARLAVESELFDGVEPEERRRRISTRISGTAVIPPLTASEINGKTGTPVSVILAPPVVLPKFEFKGKITDANRFDAIIDGRLIPIISPVDDTFVPAHHHSVAAVAAALSRLPKQSRDLIHQVTVNPVPNPLDAWWGKIYGREVNGYMTCGADGLVDIFPTKYHLDDDQIGLSLLHETGHAWTMGKFGGDFDSAGWKPWRDAMAKDGIPPSVYATASIGEDAAETTALFLATRGTPLFAEYQAIFPSRFALLTQQFGGTS